MKKLEKQDEPDKKSRGSDENHKQLSDEILEDEVGTYGMDDETADTKSKV